MEEELERAKSDYERQVEFTKQSLSELGVAYVIKEYVLIKNII